jgi:hypothetical protein
VICCAILVVPVGLQYRIRPELVKLSHICHHRGKLIFIGFLALFCRFPIRFIYIVFAIRLDIGQDIYRILLQHDRHVA